MINNLGIGAQRLGGIVGVDYREIKWPVALVFLVAILLAGIATGLITFWQVSAASKKYFTIWTYIAPAVRLACWGAVTVAAFYFFGRARQPLFLAFVVTICATVLFLPMFLFFASYKNFTFMPWLVLSQLIFHFLVFIVPVIILAWVKPLWPGIWLGWFTATALAGIAFIILLAIRTMGAAYSWTGTLRSLESQLVISLVQATLIAFVIWVGLQLLRKETHPEFEAADSLLSPVSSVAWQRVVVTAILVIGALEAVCAGLGNVPIYAIKGQTFGGSSILSFAALAFLMVLVWGVWEGRGWAVRSAGILLLVLSITGIMSFLLAEFGRGFYVPALRAGNIHAVLWVINLILGLVGGPLALLSQKQLVVNQP